MNKLPDGWAQTTIGDCQGRTSSIDPRKFPDERFDLYSVPSYTDYRPDSTLGHEIGSTKQEVQQGDVLLCKIVPHIRRGWTVPAATEHRQIASGEWIVFRDHGLEPEYLRRFVLSDGFHEQFMQTIAGVGGSLTRARPAEAAKIRLPVPPLSEQQRIVAKLGSLTGKSRRARDHLVHIPRLVEKYKQAILAAAFSKAQNFVTCCTELGEIAAEVRNGLGKKPTEGPQGTPILRISSVRPCQVRLGEIRYYQDDVPAAALLRENDLLFTRYNGNPDYTAVCGRVRDLQHEITYPDKLIRVRVIAGVDPAFVELTCSSPQVRQWLAPHIKSAAGQHGISGGDLKRLPIPVPNLAQQAEITRQVHSAFIWIDRLTVDATSARKLIDHLDQALLAKAFKGELVPQNPFDEPAGILLERIRSERAAAPKAKRGRKKAA